MSKAFYNRWVTPGDETTIPAIGSPQNEPQTDGRHARNVHRWGTKNDSMDHGSALPDTVWPVPDAEPENGANVSIEKFPGHTADR